MNSFIHQLFFILIYAKSAYTYPNGAPNTVCGTMMPGHNVSSQTCSTNYLLQTDKSQYYTNETVQITVSGSTSSDTFRGVLLTAKTQNSGQIIGTWTIVSSNIKVLNCNGVAKTGVTHISNNDKTSVVAIWSPPSTIPTENTVIRATIVKQFVLIYVNCFNVTLTNRQIDPSNITSGTIMTVATTTIATTTASQTSNIGVNITWTYTNGVTAVKMAINNLQTSQWFALGLSLDYSMGDDHVFVCKRLANDTIQVQRYINPGGHTAPQLAGSDEGGIFNTTLEKFDNGLSYCEFTLSNFSNSKRRRRAIALLSQSITYHPLIAMGNLDSSDGLIQHIYRSALLQNVQLNQQETISYNIHSTDSVLINLARAHGIIMVFAWILFASTGILIARHFKPLWPEKKICGKVIWFSIHRAVMISVVLLTIIAFILILVHEQGQWIPRNEQPEFAHSIIGIIIICFAIIQPIMAIFRCKPDADYRFIFNYIHRTIGLTSLILSIIAIFTAMFFHEFDFQTNKEWGIMVLWACWIPIIFLIFWFIDFHFQRIGIDEENCDSYCLDELTSKNERVQRVNRVLQDRIKLGFLLLHILVAFGFALALAILIGKG